MQRPAFGANIAHSKKLVEGTTMLEVNRRVIEGEEIKCFFNSRQRLKAVSILEYMCHANMPSSFRARSGHGNGGLGAYTISMTVTGRPTRFLLLLQITSRLQVHRDLSIAQVNLMLVTEKAGGQTVKIVRPKKQYRCSALFDEENDSLSVEHHQAHRQRRLKIHYSVHISFHPSCV